jgi:hypothetical protein
MTSQGGLNVTVHGHTHHRRRVSAGDVAEAHKADLETQGKCGVSYLRYWVDEDAGRIFCLVEADDAEAAITVHREAHGLVADAIYPVSEHS